MSAKNPRIKELVLALCRTVVDLMSDLTLGSKFALVVVLLLFMACIKLSWGPFIYFYCGIRPNTQNETGRDR